MEDRGKKINIYILLLAIKYIFISKQFAYKHSYIINSGAKIAITFIDTFNHHYCKIFNKIPNCKLIFIQNGRGAAYRYHNVKKSLNADYYFVNSSSYIDYSAKYLNANYIIAGSIIANNYKKTKLNKVDKIQWVSQYKTNPFVFSNRTYLFKDAVLKSTSFYLKIISEFCFYNHLKLEIIGLSNNFERKISLKISPNAVFLPKSKSYMSSYKKLSPSAIITGMDSQLLYEAFGLGYRTAFFSRNNFVNDNSWSFTVQPTIYKNNDNFYTNRPNRFIVLKIF